MAFTTMVEPWMSEDTAPRGTAAFARPSWTPCANAAGVVSTLANATECCSSSKTTTSVKVPPMSTATRTRLLPISHRASAAAMVRQVHGEPIVPGVFTRTDRLPQGVFAGTGFDQRDDPEVDAFKVRVGTVVVTHDHCPICLKPG